MTIFEIKYMHSVIIQENFHEVLSFVVANGSETKAIKKHLTICIDNSDRYSSDTKTKQSTIYTTGNVMEYLASIIEALVSEHAYNSHRFKMLYRIAWKLLEIFSEVLKNDTFLYILLLFFNFVILDIA